MHSEIIAVGSELLSFGRLDTNSLFITSRLATLGIPVRFKGVVGDRVDDIADQLSLALGRSDIVFVTGGLGPTTDDLTREAVAMALNREMSEDPEQLLRMEQIYRKWGRTMSANNRRQAMVPSRARVLENSRGTAPGLFLLEGEKMIFVLPGPPRELNPIVDKDVIPLIRKYKGVRELPCRMLKVASVAESALDARIEGIYRRWKEVETTILSSPGIISLYFLWRGKTRGDRTEFELDNLVNEIKEKVGLAVFTDKEENLEDKVGSMLAERNLTVALAESCTGGLISKMLTDVPGSSKYFHGGVVSYSNSVKETALGVDPELIRTHGAVSSQVAAGMADGVRRILGADIGLSVTGIAGPTGGTSEKPVGTVFIGLSARHGSQTWNHRAVGGRDIIRLRSANLALDRLRIWLINGE